MWTEMSGVQAELKFTEQKMRHQMREELELQVGFHEKRCADTVCFIRSKADLSILQVRKASHAQMNAELVKTRHAELVAAELTRTQQLDMTEKRHSSEILQLVELQRQYIVRVHELQVENKSLQSRIRSQEESASVKEYEARRIQHRDAQAISALEQQLNAKDPEIELVREAKIIPPSPAASRAVAPSVVGLADAKAFSKPRKQPSGSDSDTHSVSRGRGGILGARGDRHPNRELASDVGPTRVLVQQLSMKLGEDD